MKMINRDSYRMLKSIYKNKKLNPQNFSEQQWNAAQSLIDAGYAYFLEGDHIKIETEYPALIFEKIGLKITEDGKAYVENRRGVSRQTKFSNILSIIATVISVIATIISIIALLKQ